VTDLDAAPLAMITLPHGRHADRAAVVELFGSAVRRLLVEAGLAEETPLGIGIGVPGEVDPMSASVARSPLPDWVDSGLASLLENHLGMPVLIDNDVNTLTIAEHLYGAGRSLDDLLVLSIGRGIGMGAVVGGQVARGGHGGLGEIGHVRVRPEGPACWCGGHGCLEVFAAEPALVREVLALRGEVVAPDALAALGDEDDRVASLLAEAGQLVGVVLATAIALFDPQRVIVSGEGVRLGRHYLDGLRSGLREQSQPRDIPDLVIEPWGDEAWARGAASLVLRELFHPAHLREERHPPGVAIAPRGDPLTRAAS
jgi:predicted NBD/HSP70 family sugar kinase